MDGHTSYCGCCDSAAPRTGPRLMPLAEAVDLAQRDCMPPTRRDIRPLASALGRVTAEPVIAPGPLPRFDLAAMDGVALRIADLPGNRRLPLAGTVAAGDAAGNLPPGHAMQIFTGAPVPMGADAVVMIERCKIASGQVQIDHGPRRHDNIRQRGSDQAEAETLIPTGTRLRPDHIGLLAANGLRKIAVWERPRIAVFSTGNEVTDAACTGGQINDANRPMLLALIAEAGGDPVDAGVIPDDLASTAAALAGIAQDVDLIVTSGGVSMGEKDHLYAALKLAGGVPRGWRVAIKPGKPVLFGQIGEAVYTGLPGNPFAVHVGFHLFLAPQIARLSGLAPQPFAPVPARAGFTWRRKPGRAEVFPVRLTGYDGAGRPVLARLGRGVSGTLLPLSGADGVAIIPADAAEIHPGDQLHWQPLRQGEFQ